MKFFDEFRKRDFKQWYKQNDGIKRPMKNSTIIEELEITAAEMGEMTSIIGREEKRIRNTDQKRKQRREQGVLQRDEYLEQQKNQKEDKLW